jgi:glutamate synthase domain-containing protein 2
MIPEGIREFVFYFLAAIAVLVTVLLGLALITALITYLIDITQTKHAIRRNYPVIGRFRYMFEHLGEFFRQYFFAMDREEMPFNRAQRAWCYRSAKGLDNTVAFGSTRDLKPPGTVMFVSCPYPTLGEDAAPPRQVTIGPYASKPYVTDSVFNISGMSFGAISKPAIRALSNGARMAGCWLNTGEGGLSPYHLDGGCDIVFQIGTAKNGVRDLDGNLDEDKLRSIAAHEQVRMIELKLSQGAKPGKGGMLPGAKVDEKIARIRGLRVGQDAISPNRHIDINNNAQLLDMLERLRRVSGKPVGFKTVLGAAGWLDELFAEIHRRGVESAPDFITVDGAEGGTGAAPMPLIDSVGLPLREALPMLVDKVVEYGLRDRIRIVASGKLVTPSEVAAAICVGADFVVSARGFMFALGCIQALQCNKNTCPTGITTHDERLQRGLVPEDKATRVAQYHAGMMKEVGMIAHSCGARSAQGMRRVHARVVMNDGRSRPLNELYPEPAPMVLERTRTSPGAQVSP